MPFFKRALAEVHYAVAAGHVGSSASSRSRQSGTSRYWTRCGAVIGNRRSLAAAFSRAIRGLRSGPEEGHLPSAHTTRNSRIMGFLSLDYPQQERSPLLRRSPRICELRPSGEQPTRTTTLLHAVQARYLGAVLVAENGTECSTSHRWLGPRSGRDEPGDCSGSPIRHFGWPALPQATPCDATHSRGQGSSRALRGNSVESLPRYPR